MTGGGRYAMADEMRDIFDEPDVANDDGLDEDDLEGDDLDDETDEEENDEPFAV
jgi:Ran GTPase-activating protein (RanGAP) involved in mRNA processing and transport